MNVNKKILSFSLFSLILIGFLMLPLLTSAAGLQDINPALDTTAQGAGVKGESSFIQLLATLISALLSIIGLVFVVLIIYGGFKWMTAMGNEENVRKARNILTSSVIGLIIIILSYAIAYYVTASLQPSTTRQSTYLARLLLN